MLFINNILSNNLLINNIIHTYLYIKSLASASFYYFLQIFIIYNLLSP